MQRTSLVTLLVVILVAIAGCNAFCGWADTTPETPPVTPMDVPTDDLSPTVTPRDTQQLPAQCKPGLTEIGFANASALAAAHNTTLWNTSFTMRASSTRIDQNSTVLAASSETVYVQNDSRMYFISKEVGHGREERWINGEQVLTREISGYSGYTASYGVRRAPIEHFRRLARDDASRPSDVLDNATACVINQFPHNGTTLFVVAFTHSRQPNVGPHTTVLKNVTGRALVGASGIVYELRWQYTVRTDDGAVVTVMKRTYYTDIGLTTVERPLWYEQAVNES